MQFSAVSVLEAHGPHDVREAVAEGRHLSTLAFSRLGFPPDERPSCRRCTRATSCEVRMLTPR